MQQNTSYMPHALSHFIFHYVDSLLPPLNAASSHYHDDQRNQASYTPTADYHPGNRWNKQNSICKISQFVIVWGNMMIYLQYHFSTLKWDKEFESFPVMDRDLFILHGPLARYPGNAGNVFLAADERCRYASRHVHYARVLMQAGITN